MGIHVGTDGRSDVAEVEGGRGGLCLPKTPSSTAVTLLSNTAWSKNSRVVKNLKRIEKAWFPVS
ncbi:MAG: hypothetical protein DMG41_21620 [Acidobacteria bacterium]|nr:MAG: hypothetical protein AUH13_18485 [Acidobacteria bacterium 13_2_20CM_58_27]PYT85827.1 MAG: hypothetical protein DMG41_21620 [Acidobacteriota bacterium]